MKYVHIYIYIYYVDISLSFAIKIYFTKQNPGFLLTLLVLDLYDQIM